MNRLTVRLSIVGAVLTLGGATIAHSMLSQGDAPSTESDAGIQQVAQAPPAEPPTPIRAEESEEPAAARFAAAVGVRLHASEIIADRVA